MSPSAPSALSAGRRTRDLDCLAAGEQVDVLVVGGGVTGAGVALDAASRGLSVALVERTDLAAGTSGWSSKLVHGGLRYLAQYDFDLAFESARERGILMRHTAPHLIRALPLVSPLTEEVSRLEAGKLRAGGVVADVMRVAAGTSRRTLPSARRASAAEVVRLVPAVRRAGLRGGVVYWDGQLEDDARLVVALARTAAGYGARVVTHAEVTALDGAGADVTDRLTGATLRVRARHVVNASGVWADRFAPEVRLRPSKGAHLLVPAARLGHPQASLNIAIPGEEHRWVFVLPLPDERHCLLGLTDDPLQGEVPDVPVADDTDTAFLLATVSRGLEVPLTADDVVGSYAGLRPLLAGAADEATADLSRRHAVIESDDGVLTLVGGKLTTYRRMAQDAVDRVAARPGVAARRCVTRRLPLVGAARPAELDRIEAPARLVRRYGAEAPRVAALAADDPGLQLPVAPGLDVLGVELRFGVTDEGALTVSDLLDRRVRLGFTPAERALAVPAAEAALARWGSPVAV